ESVNDAVKFCIGKLHHRREESDERKTITDKLRAMLEHTRKSLDAAHRQSRESDRAAEYERTGSILMSNLSQLSKGMNSVVLADNIGGSGTMKITLDPKLPPARNAERYFDKAKNAKVAAKESEERMGSLGAQVSALEKLSLELDRTGTQAQFEEFIESHRAQLDALHLIPGKKGEKELPPFRVFTVAGGAEVWVGKSSANNDLLTMKYAKPNDLWFHARGSSGSHTVLRVPDPSRPPGKEAIYATASIAAYYSKMRNGKNVPVAYCEKKYVRKPKGAAVGAVTLEREKVIFVNPKLPE
ncbi:MAG TPA: NFACT RNA binding domain-containing protein, partial [Bacteroidota bacterium]|nr:NFACT RNA binding domain-containing protein [Bacteroidota bacterium]